MDSDKLVKIKQKMFLMEETKLAINCVIKGLGDLQRIDAVNDFYHAPLMFLSNGYEKLLKCILSFINLNEDGIVAKTPFETKGRKGHDIGILLEILIEELQNCNYESRSQLTRKDMEFLIDNQQLKEIIESLSDFSQGGRYYYLDIVLEGKSSFKDPVKTWEMFETNIVKNDPKLLKALVNGDVTEIYKVVVPTLIRTLERFTVALSRIFAFGRFNKEMRMMAIQVHFFLMLEDKDLGKTDYRDQTWDSLNKMRREARRLKV
jgi:hypothetical protein